MIHNIIDKKDYRDFYKKKLKYITNQETHRYMCDNRDKCLKTAIKNKNENWFDQKLKKLKHLKYRRQAIWGYRIFDFWISSLGCAIEIDGPEHDPEYDKYRDVYNYLRSGIVVIRIRNMNEEDAKQAIDFINALETWSDRRKNLSIKITNKKINLTNPKDPYWDDYKSNQSKLF